MTSNNPKIKSIQEYFKSRPVLRAYLFGSFVKGQADDQNDIDILVDLDYAHHIGLGFFQMQIDLEGILYTKVDLVSSNRLSKHIKPIVDSEKQLIYSR
jgi:predicted nucleotidyltransferase